MMCPLKVHITSTGRIMDVVDQHKRASLIYLKEQLKKSWTNTMIIYLPGNKDTLV